MAIVIIAGITLVSMACLGYLNGRVGIITFLRQPLDISIGFILFGFSLAFPPLLPLSAAFIGLFLFHYHRGMGIIHKKAKNARCDVGGLFWYNVSEAGREAYWDKEQAINDW